MAAPDYRYCVGSFIRAGSDGIQTITGIADAIGTFTPKALLLWGTYQTATGHAANARMFLGMTDGISQASTCTFQPDNFTAAGISQQFTRGQLTPSSCIIVNNSTVSGSDDSAAFSAFAEGSFALGWLAAGAITQHLVHFLALGGADLAATMGFFSTPGSPGNQTIATDPVGQISGLIVLTVLAAGSVHTGGIASANTAIPCFGWVDTSGAQTALVASTALGDTGTDITIGHRAQRADHAVIDFNIPVTTPTVTRLAAVTSLDVDRFVLNWSAVAAGPFGTSGSYYLALSGPTVTAGRLTQPATAVTVPVALTAPAGVVLMASVSHVASTAIENDAYVSVGAGTDLAQGHTFIGYPTAINPSRAASLTSTTSVLTLGTVDAIGGAVTVAAAARYVSAAGGFAVQWTSVDATPREVIYLAFQGTAIPPTPPGLATVTYPIRRIRQAPHLWDGEAGARLTYPGLQLLVESGVRVAEAGPLTFYLQWSDDGGHTWGNLHQIEGATLGQYRYRFWWRRLGQSRDRVFRVINSDDAKIVLLDALLVPDPIQGAH